MNDLLKTLAAEARKKAAIHRSYFKKLKKRALCDLDITMQQLHEEVFDNIDCLSCANCCQTLGPRLTDKDIVKIATALRRRPAEIVTDYLRIDEDGDYVFRTMPCPFLATDNYCAIYEQRPKACREYPHTDRKKFIQIYPLTIKNAETCPAVFEILERLTKNN